MSGRRGRRAHRLLAIALVTACADGGGDPPSRSDTVNGAFPARREAADSAAGDSAAFASLPPSLRSALDVRHVLSPEWLGDTARTYCQPLGREDAAEERRRLRFRLGDTLGVLFVRAERRSGALRRVELVRRPLTGGLQHGFSWDAEGDVTQEYDWTADRADAVAPAALPRGGPAPRALRGLGRLLLAAPCGGARRP